MTDFHVPRSPNESPALHACRHVLARMRNDSNFAWHMLNTESLRLCVAAVAEADGVHTEQLASEIDTVAGRLMQRQRPKVLDLQDEIDELSDQLVDAEWRADEHEGQAERLQDELKPLAICRQVRSSLADLILHCQMTGRQPTVEALERIHSGQHLEYALMEMA